MDLNLPNYEVAQRKTLITVAEWKSGTGNTTTRQILGTRTEDSSIEFNADVQSLTDIRGITWVDVNKTEPQQTFDPFYIMGGDKLAEYLSEAALTNNIAAYTNIFTIYIIAAFSGSASKGYYTVKHENCSIIPTSIGGDAKVAMPVECYYSNNITVGTVDKLDNDFVFTQSVSV